MVAPIYTGTMVTSLPRIALLGTGNMGGAILGGLLQPGVTTAGIVATTLSEASAVTLRERGVEAISVELNPSANAEAVRDADIIVLGVKPHAILDLLSDIAPHAKSDALVMSVAAGITLGAMATVWPGALVRAMPNTPAQVGRGVTGIALGQGVTSAQAEGVRAMWETTGSVLEVDESQINALSALSGSGPAYVYFFIERFVEVAQSYGFSDDQARRMVHGTFAGAIELLERSGEAPADLRTAVTSPGGTTEAALKVFSHADLTSIIHAATDAAISRAREIAGD
jgi:pyrroline-5-carboxylate reductase